MGSVCSLSENDFLSFKRQFEGWEKKFQVYDRDQDSVYKRITCAWDQHQYHACINVNTGDIYLDCQRRKILAKHIVFIFLRPLHITAKTLWHASIIGPLTLEIFKTAKRNQSAKDGLKNFGISVLDIALTPLCGIAMIITSIATVILSPFSPNTLYRGRDIVGYLERVMHHTEDLIHSEIPSLSPCFSPIANIATVHRQFGKKDQLDSLNDVINGLQECARAQINYRKNTRAIFNDWCRLHPNNVPYVSSAALKHTDELDPATLSE